MSTTLTQQSPVGRVRRAASTRVPVASPRRCGVDTGRSAHSYATGFGLGMWTTGAVGHETGSANPTGLPAIKRAAQHLRVRST